MFSDFYKKFLGFQVVCAISFLSGMSEASAQQQAVDFSTIARNISDSVAEIPGLITGLAYLLGLLMGVMGVLKIKDHVDNPEKAPLKEGAIRLAAGGAMFALPVLYDSMLNTIGTTSNLVSPAPLSRVQFNVR